AISCDGASERHANHRFKRKTIENHMICADTNLRCKFCIPVRRSTFPEMVNNRLDIFTKLRIISCGKPGLNNDLELRIAKAGPQPFNPLAHGKTRTRAPLRLLKPGANALTDFLK